MKALLFGVILLAAALVAIIPAGLGWGNDVLAFLRGGLPVIAIFVALIAGFVGIADIKDRAEAKKEEAGENKEEGA
jgi:hypothetical protein